MGRARARTDRGTRGEDTRDARAAVNHVSGKRAGVAGVYNKSGLRREALERWAKHVAGVVVGAPVNVVSLKRGAGKRRLSPAA
jgi:hypothetical protein